MVGQKSSKVQSVFFHIFSCLLGFIMVYPLLWLLMSSFKSNDTMFHNAWSLHPGKVGRAHELRLRLAGHCGHPVLALYTEQCHRHGGVGGRHHLLLPAGSLRGFPSEIQGRKLLVRLHRHDYDDPFSGHGGAPVPSS